MLHDAFGGLGAFLLFFFSSYLYDLVPVSRHFGLSKLLGDAICSEFRITYLLHFPSFFLSLCIHLSMVSRAS